MVASYTMASMHHTPSISSSSVQQVAGPIFVSDTNEMPTRNRYDRAKTNIVLY